MTRNLTISALPALLIALGSNFAVAQATATSSHTASVAAATAAATQQTQALLRDGTAREKALTTPEAKASDKQVKDLMGSDSQALYELAADILPTIVNESGGDSIKIQGNIDQLAKNPESLNSQLTADQKARLQDLAKRAEARQPASSTPH